MKKCWKEKKNGQLFIKIDSLDKIAKVYGKSF